MWLDFGFDDCGGGGDIGSRLLAVLHDLHD